MMRSAFARVALLVYLALTPVAAPAQDADSVVKACNSALHRAFDFWIGEWDVTDHDGKKAGQSRIERVLGGCALHESWRGSDGSRGHSYSMYDAATKQWHQQWVDIGGNLLRLSGGGKNGTIVLEGANIVPTGIAYSMITWTLLLDGRVRQHWQLSTDNKKTWKTHFDGYYRRAGRQQ